MLASNFPVDKGNCNDVAVWNAFKILAADFSNAEKDELFHSTAAAVSRITAAENLLQSVSKGYIMPTHPYSSSAAPAHLSEEAIYRKRAWRIVPLLVLCHFFAYLDRVNVGFAKMQMQQELGLSEIASAAPTHIRPVMSRNSGLAPARR